MASYKPPQNYRSAASRTPTPEPFSVVNGVALLAEAPADPGDGSTPMVVTVGGQPRTRVTTTPNAGEFMVRTATSPQGTAFLPVLEFNAADEGLDGTCDYYRTGTVYTSEWFGFFLSFLRPIVGLASLDALQAAYPASSDYTQPGYPGRQAFLSDQTAWFSDGVAWRQLSGNAQAIIAVDALMAAQFGSAYDAIASHVGALSAGFTSGLTMDGSWLPPGNLAGAFSAAVTMAAQLDAAFVGSGLTGDIADTFTSGASLDATWAAGGSTGITRVGVSAVTPIPFNVSVPVPIPGPVLAGDIIVLYTNITSTPTGFTYKISSTQPTQCLYWKRAVGGETSVTVGLGPGGAIGLAVVAVYRGCIGGTVDPFDFATIYGGNSGSSVGTQSIAAASGDMVFFASMFFTSDSTNPPAASWLPPSGSTAVTTLAQDVSPTPGAYGQTGLAFYEAGVLAPGTYPLTASFAGELTTKQIKALGAALKAA